MTTPAPHAQDVLQIREDESLTAYVTRLEASAANHDHIAGNLQGLLEQRSSLDQHILDVQDILASAAACRERVAQLREHIRGTPTQDLPAPALDAVPLTPDVQDPSAAEPHPAPTPLPDGSTLSGDHATEDQPAEHANPPATPEPEPAPEADSVPVPTQPTEPAPHAQDGAGHVDPPNGKRPLISRLEDWVQAEMEPGRAYDKREIAAALGIIVAPIGRAMASAMERKWVVISETGEHYRWMDPVSLATPGALRRNVLGVFTAAPTVVWDLSDQPQEIQAVLLELRGEGLIGLDEPPADYSLAEPSDVPFLVILDTLRAHFQGAPDDVHPFEALAALPDLDGAPEHLVRGALHHLVTLDEVEDAQDADTGEWIYSHVLRH